MWTPRRPEFACAANSVSLMMPTIEPYFVRAMQAALPALDESLTAGTRTYISQEAAHLAQHRRYNQRLVDRYPALGPVDRLTARVYRRVERSGSTEFNLAFAATSETMAYSAARWAADRRTDLLADADPVSSTLFLWHLAEEVEHKSAAFEVHRAVAGTSLRAGLRMVAAMAVALALVVLFVIAGTTVMVVAEGRLYRPIAWLRLIGWSVTFAFELLTNLALSVLPGFHPEDLTDPAWYEVWLREFDTESGTLPLWLDPGEQSEAVRDPATASRSLTATGVEPI